MDKLALITNFMNKVELGLDGAKETAMFIQELCEFEPIPINKDYFVCSNVAFENIDAIKSLKAPVRVDVEVYEEWSDDGEYRVSISKGKIAIQNVTLELSANHDDSEYEFFNEFKEESIALCKALGLEHNSESHKFLNNLIFELGESARKEIACTFFPEGTVRLN